MTTIKGYTQVYDAIERIVREAVINDCGYSTIKSDGSMYTRIATYIAPTQSQDDPSYFYCVWKDNDDGLVVIRKQWDLDEAYDGGDEYVCIPSQMTDEQVADLVSELWDELFNALPQPIEALNVGCDCFYCQHKRMAK